MSHELTISWAVSKSHNTDEVVSCLATSDELYELMTRRDVAHDDLRKEYGYVDVWSLTADAWRIKVYPAV